MTGYLLMITTPVALLAGSLVGAWRLKLNRRDELGLRLPRWDQALTSLGLFLALSVLTELLYQRWGLADTGQAWHIKYSASALLIRMIFIALVYPFAEEIFFRGFILGALRRRFGDLVAIAGSSAFFAALHIQYDLRGMALVLIDAVFFALVRTRTNSTLLAILLHILGNSYAVWQRF